MTIYEKDEIRRGIFIEKDCSLSVVIAKSDKQPSDLSDIQRRLDSDP